MGIKINKLRIKNITSYVGDNEIDLSNMKYKNFVILNGRIIDDVNTNGSGKSSIVYSILASLGLLPNFKSIKSLNSDDDSEIKLELINEDNNHKITVHRIFNSGRKSELNINSTNPDDLMFLRVKDNQDFLKNKLNIDTNFLLTHIFTPSNESIYDLSSTQLFDLLEKLFKIDEMDNLNTYLKNKIKDIKNEITIKENKIKSNDDLINTFLKKNIEEFKQKKENINITHPLDDSKNKIRNKINEIQSYLNNLKKVSLNLNLEEILNNSLYDKLIETLKIVSKEVDSHINKIQKEINNLSSNEKHYKNIIKEYSNLKTLNKCPVCKQTITNETKLNYEKFIIEYTDKLNDIVKQRQSLNNEIEQYKQDYKILLKLQSEFNVLTSLLNELTNVMKNKMETQKLIDSEIKKYEEKLKEVTNENEQLKKEIISLSDTLNILNFLYNITKKKSEIRQKYIYSFIEQLKFSSSEFQSILNENESFDIELDETRSNQIIFGIRRSNVLIPFKLLSNGERKKTSIILIFTILKILNLTNNESKLKLLVFDDFFNGLDNNNIYKILNTMYEFSNKYDYQIIISNNNIEKIDFPCVVVDIVKDESGISYIESIRDSEFM
jgi:DNA repair exonuclease SbcCD ATPase subunit